MTPFLSGGMSSMPAMAPAAAPAAGGQMSGPMTFQQWMKMKNPEMYDDFMTQLGLTGGDNDNAGKQTAMQIGMSGGKPPISMPQMQQMSQQAANKTKSLMQQNQKMMGLMGGPPTMPQARPPMGLMG